MHARLVHRVPGADRAHDETDDGDRTGTGVEEPAAGRENDDEHQREQHHGEVDVGREQHRDEDDPDDVVEDGQRKEEDAHSGGQTSTEDGEHSQREGDVGGCGNGPSGAGRLPAAISTYSTTGTITPPAAAIAGSTARRGEAS
jgi:hypothetical protein